MQLSISQALSMLAMTLLVAGYGSSSSSRGGSTSKLIKLGKNRKVTISKADESTLADLEDKIKEWDGSQYSKKLLEKLKSKKDKKNDKSKSKNKNKNKKSKKDDKNKNKKSKKAELKKKVLAKAKRPARIAYLRPLKRKSSSWSRMAARKGKWTYGAIRVQDKCSNNRKVDKKVIKEAMLKAVQNGKYYSVNCDGDILLVDKLTGKK